VATCDDKDPKNITQSGSRFLLKVRYYCLLDPYHVDMYICLLSPLENTPLHIYVARIFISEVIKLVKYPKIYPNTLGIYLNNHRKEKTKRTHSGKYLTGDEKR
jgi:hypothetical protein